MTKGYFQNDPEQLFEFYLELKLIMKMGKEFHQEFGL